MKQQIDDIIIFIKSYALSSNSMKTEDIAKHFGYSKYHFSREFKRLTGYSVSSFISSLKIEDSLHLLSTEKSSVLNAQVKAGFLSEGSFTNTFKKYTGVSPSEHKQNIDENYYAIKSCENAQTSSEVIYEDKKTKEKYSCFVNIEYPKNVEFTAIFVGLFNTPIPNHKPIVGKALFLKKTCVLRNIPNGNYYILACGIEKGTSLPNYFKLDSCYRGMVDNMISFPNSCNAPFNISLRKPLPTDPPILINLPNLVKISLNKNDRNLG